MDYETLWKNERFLSLDPEKKKQAIDRYWSLVTDIKDEGDLESIMALRDTAAAHTDAMLRKDTASPYEQDALELQRVDSLMKFRLLKKLREGTLTQADRDAYNTKGQDILKAWTKRAIEEQVAAKNMETTYALKGQLDPVLRFQSASQMRTGVEPTSYDAFGSFFERADDTPNRVGGMLARGSIRDTVDNLKRDAFKTQDATDTQQTIAQYSGIGGQQSELLSPQVSNEIRKGEIQADIDAIGKVGEAFGKMGVLPENQEKWLDDIAKVSAWTSRGDDVWRVLNFGEAVHNPANLFGNRDQVITALEKLDISPAAKKRALLNYENDRKRVATESSDVINDEADRSNVLEYNFNEVRELLAKEHGVTNPTNEQLLDAITNYNLGRNGVESFAGALAAGGWRGGKRLLQTALTVSSLGLKGVGADESANSVFGWSDAMRQDAAYQERVDAMTGVNQGSVNKFTKTIAQTITEMAPMFGAGKLAQMAKTGLGKGLIRFAGIQGTAFGQGVGSIYERKLATMQAGKGGAPLTPEDYASVLADGGLMQGALLNGFQTALGTYLFPKGSQRIAGGGGITAREFLSRWRMASKGTIKANLKNDAKNLLKTLRADMADEGAEELSNQMLETLIARVSNASPDTPFSQILKEWGEAYILGSVAGGIVPAMRNIDKSFQTELRKAENAFTRSSNELQEKDGELFAQFLDGTLTPEARAQVNAKVRGVIGDKGLQDLVKNWAWRDSVNARIDERNQEAPLAEQNMGDLEKKSAVAIPEAAPTFEDNVLDWVESIPSAMVPPTNPSVEFLSEGEADLSEPGMLIEPPAGTPLMPPPVDPTTGSPLTLKLHNFSNPDLFYRVVVGDEAFQDIVDSGEVRTNASSKPKPSGGKIDLSNRPTAFPSFAKGKAAMSYAQDNPNNYIIVSADPSLKPSKLGRHGKGSTVFPTDENGDELSSLSGSKVDVYMHVGDGNYQLVYSKGKAIAGESSTPKPTSEPVGTPPVNSGEKLVASQEGERVAKNLANRFVFNSSVNQQDLVAAVAGNNAAYQDILQLQAKPERTAEEETKLAERKAEWKANLAKQYFGDQPFLDRAYAAIDALDKGVANRTPNMQSKDDANWTNHPLLKAIAAEGGIMSPTSSKEVFDNVGDQTQALADSLTDQAKSMVYRTTTRNASGKLEGGTPIDVLAEALVRKGELTVPANMKPEEALIQELAKIPNVGKTAPEAPVSEESFNRSQLQGQIEAAEKSGVIAEGKAAELGKITDSGKAMSAFENARTEQEFRGLENDKALPQGTTDKFIAARNAAKGDNASVEKLVADVRALQQEAGFYFDVQEVVEAGQQDLAEITGEPEFEPTGVEEAVEPEPTAEDIRDEAQFDEEVDSPTSKVDQSKTDGVSITNLDEILAQGGGTVRVSDNGRAVNFKQFGVVIDGKTAEVAFVELDPSERGSGVGKKAYKALGDALLAKGIILQSSKAQYKDGNALWKKLATEGLARQGGQGVFYYTGKQPATPTPELVLESQTPEQVEAEKAAKAQKDAVQAKSEAPLKGTAGEMGTPDLFDPLAGETPLFDQQAKPAAPTPQPEFQPAPLTNQTPQDRSKELLDDAAQANAGTKKPRKQNAGIRKVVGANPDQQLASLRSAVDEALPGEGASVTFAKAPTKEHTKLSDAANYLFGKKVVWFKGPPSLHGTWITTQPDTIFLNLDYNVGDGKNLLTLERLWRHELAHSLKANMTAQEYKDFVDRFKKLAPRAYAAMLDRRDAAVVKFARQLPEDTVNPEELVREKREKETQRAEDELLAQVIEATPLDRDFFDTMKGERNLLQKILDFLTNLVHKLESIPAEYRNRQFVEDVENAKELRELVTEYFERGARGSVIRERMVQAGGKPDNMSPEVFALATAAMQGDMEAYGKLSKVVQGVVTRAQTIDLDQRYLDALDMGDTLTAQQLLDTTLFGAEGVDLLTRYAGGDQNALRRMTALWGQDRVKQLKGLKTYDDLAEKLADLKEVSREVGEADQMGVVIRPSVKAEIALFSMDEKPTDRIDYDRIAELGTTTDWFETGYITPEGKQIDLSGKKEGGSRGERSYDHREAGGTAGMQQFIAQGNIRVSPNKRGHASIHLMVAPTTTQERALKNFISLHDGNVVVEVEDGLGSYYEDGRYYNSSRRTTNLEYDEAKPVKVVGDIKRFFGGEDVKSGVRFSQDDKAQLVNPRVEKIGNRSVYTIGDSIAQVTIEGDRVVSVDNQSAIPPMDLLTKVLAMEGKPVTVPFDMVPQDRRHLDWWWNVGPEARFSMDADLPPIPHDHVRLWRAEVGKMDAPVPDWMKGTEEFNGVEDASGRWFYKTRGEAELHVKSQEGRGISYVDVPSSEVESYNAKNNPFAGGYGRDGNEYFVSREVADSRKPDIRFSMDQGITVTPTKAALAKLEQDAKVYSGGPEMDIESYIGGDTELVFHPERKLTARQEAIVTEFSEAANAPTPVGSLVARLQQHRAEGKPVDMIQSDVVEPWEATPEGRKAAKTMSRLREEGYSYEGWTRTRPTSFATFGVIPGDTLSEAEARKVKVPAVVIDGEGRLSYPFDGGAIEYNLNGAKPEARFSMDVEDRVGRLTKAEKANDIAAARAALPKEITIAAVDSGDVDENGNPELLYVAALGITREVEQWERSGDSTDKWRIHESGEPITPSQAREMLFDGVLAGLLPRKEINAIPVQTTTVKAGDARFSMDEDATPGRPQRRVRQVFGGTSIIEKAPADVNAAMDMMAEFAQYTPSRELINLFENGDLRWFERKMVDFRRQFLPALKAEMSDKLQRDLMMPVYLAKYNRQLGGRLTAAQKNVYLEKVGFGPAIYEAALALRLNRVPTDIYGPDLFMQEIEARVRDVVVKKATDAQKEVIDTMEDADMPTADEVQKDDTESAELAEEGNSQGTLEGQALALVDSIIDKLVIKPGFNKRAREFFAKWNKNKGYVADNRMSKSNEEDQSLLRQILAVLKNPSNYSKEQVTEAQEIFDNYVEYDSSVTEPDKQRVKKAIGVLRNPEKNKDVDKLARELRRIEANDEDGVSSATALEKLYASFLAGRTSLEDFRKRFDEIMDVAFPSVSKTVRDALFERFINASKVSASTKARKTVAEVFENMQEKLKTKVGQNRTQVGDTKVETLESYLQSLLRKVDLKKFPTFGEFQSKVTELSLTPEEVPPVEKINEMYDALAARQDQLYRDAAMAKAARLEPKRNETAKLASSVRKGMDEVNAKRRERGEPKLEYRDLIDEFIVGRGDDNILPELEAALAVDGVDPATIKKLAVDLVAFYLDQRKQAKQLLEDENNDDPFDADTKADQQVDEDELRIKLWEWVETYGRKDLTSKGEATQTLWGLMHKYINSKTPNPEAFARALRNVIAEPNQNAVIPHAMYWAEYLRAKNSVALPNRIAGHSAPVIMVPRSYKSEAELEDMLRDVFPGVPEAEIIVSAKELFKVMSRARNLDTLAVERDLALRLDRNMRQDDLVTLLKGKAHMLGLKDEDAEAVAQKRPTVTLRPMLTKRIVDNLVMAGKVFRSRERRHLEYLDILVSQAGFTRDAALAYLEAADKKGISFEMKLNNAVERRLDEKKARVAKALQEGNFKTDDAQKLAEAIIILHKDFNHTSVLALNALSTLNQENGTPLIRDEDFYDFLKAAEAYSGSPNPVVRAMAQRKMAQIMALVQDNPMMVSLMLESFFSSMYFRISSITLNGWGGMVDAWNKRFMFGIEAMRRGRDVGAALKFVTATWKRGWQHARASFRLARKTAVHIHGLSGIDRELHSKGDDIEELSAIEIASEKLKRGEEGVWNYIETFGARAALWQKKWTTVFDEMYKSLQDEMTRDNILMWQALNKGMNIREVLDIFNKAYDKGMDEDVLNSPQTQALKNIIGRPGDWVTLYKLMEARANFTLAIDAKADLGKEEIDRISAMSMLEAGYSMGNIPDEDTDDTIAVKVLRAAQEITTLPKWLRKIREARKEGRSVAMSQFLYGAWRIGAFGLLGPITIPGMLYNKALYWAPLISQIRLLRRLDWNKSLKEKKIIFNTARDKEFQGSMRTPEQFIMRSYDSLGGLVLTTILSGMVWANWDLPDEEKWFRINLGGPMNFSDYDKWRMKGNKPYTATFRLGNRNFTMNFDRELDAVRMPFFIAGLADSIRYMNRSNSGSVSGVHQAIWDIVQTETFSGFAFGRAAVDNMRFATGFQQKAVTEVMQAYVSKLLYIAPVAGAGMWNEIDRHISAGGRQYTSALYSLNEPMPLFNWIFSGSHMRDHPALNHMGLPIAEESIYVRVWNMVMPVKVTHDTWARNPHVKYLVKTDYGPRALTERQYYAQYAEANGMDVNDVLPVADPEILYNATKGFGDRLREGIMDEERDLKRYIDKGDIDRARKVLENVRSDAQRPSTEAVYKALDAANSNKPR